MHFEVRGIWLHILVGQGVKFKKSEGGRFDSGQIPFFSRWPPKWPLFQENAYISVNNHHITVIFMSKNRFLGPRNTLEQTKICLLQCEALFSRWLPRWPLFQKNAYISANTQHIKVILVLKSRFLGSRNTLNKEKICYIWYEALYSKWLPRWMVCSKDIANISVNTQHIKVISVSESRFLWSRNTLEQIKYANFDMKPSVQDGWFVEQF